MKVNRLFHMIICKYLWNTKWQSFFEDRILMWTKDSSNYYRTKKAFEAQLADGMIDDCTDKDKKTSL